MVFGFGSATETFPKSETEPYPESIFLFKALSSAGIVQLRQGLDGRADCQRAKELAGRRGETEACLEAEQCLAVQLQSAGPKQAAGRGL